MFQFYHPFTGVCSGPTGCGKTELMKNIILNAASLIKPKPDVIKWYYSQFQPDLENALTGLVEFKNCLPDISDFNGEERTLIIVDDFMGECNSKIADLFTKGSHHKNVSIWFLLQNFFHPNKHIRTATRNSQYIIMFKNPRDIGQIKHLSTQMYGKTSKVLEEAYLDATEKPYGYLLLDFKQQTPEYFRLRSNILSNESLVIYADKSKYKKDVIQIENKL